MFYLYFIISLMVDKNNINVEVRVYEAGGDCFRSKVMKVVAEDFSGEISLDSLSEEAQALVNEQLDGDKSEKFKGRSGKEVTVRIKR